MEQNNRPPVARRVFRKGEEAFRIPLWVSLLLFIALILLRDLGGVPVPRIFFTAIAGLSFLFLKENEDFALLYAIVPFSTRINFNEITLAFFVVYFLRRFQKKLPHSFVLMLAVLFIELFSILTFSGDVMIFIRFAVLFLIGVLTVSTEMSRENVLTILFSYVTSTVLVCVNVYIITFSRVSHETFFQWGYRFGHVSSFVHGSLYNLSHYDPNELGAFIVVGFFMLMMLWYVRRISIWMFLPPAAILLYCYALTQSRGSLLALGVFIVLFWLGTMRTFKEGFYYSVVAISALLVMVVLFSGPLNTVYERFVYRFSVDDVTGGRTDIWGDILNKQIADPIRFLFGYGTRGYTQITDNAAAHNTLLDAYASWGIVGFSLVGIWHFSVVRDQIRQVREARAPSAEQVRYRKNTPWRIPMIYFVPYLSVLVAAMSLQYYMVTILSLLFSISQLSIRLAELDDEHARPYAELAFERKAARKAKKAVTPLKEKAVEQ